MVAVGAGDARAPAAVPREADAPERPARLGSLRLFVDGVSFATDALARGAAWARGAASAPGGAPSTPRARAAAARGDAAVAAPGAEEGAHSLEELADLVGDGGEGGPASDGAAGLTVEDVEDRVVWSKNAPLLYDLFVSVSLEWPALCAQWLPDEEGEACRLAVGTHSSGSGPSESELLVLEFNCEAEESIEMGNPWRTWSISGLGNARGFGCNALDDRGLLRPLARMQHPTEVNRVAVCPQRAQLLASKAANGAVLLFDYKADRTAGEASPDATLAASGAGADGFALGWSSLSAGLLASGGNDGRLCVWDVEVGPKVRASAPLQDRPAHEGPLGDLGFSRRGPAVVATVGDDGQLRLWDTRAGEGPQLEQRVSDVDVLSVDWSFFQEWTLATSSKDGAVRVWDLRAAGDLPGSPPQVQRAPVHDLRGHTGDAVAVRWAPFRPGLLASCGTDSRVCFWDLEASGDSDGEDPAEGKDPPQLLLSHMGHWEGVSDFSWSPVDDYLACSVAEDNSLQIWQPSTTFYLGDSDDERAPAGAPAERPAKRQRQE